MNPQRRILTIVLLAMVSLCFQITATNAEVLNVYILAGQSNMEGQAYTYNSAETANWNVVTLEFLLSGSPAATAYVESMPYGIKGSFNGGKGFELLTELQQLDHQLQMQLFKLTDNSPVLAAARPATAVRCFTVFGRIFV